MMPVARPLDATRNSQTTTSYLHSSPGVLAYATFEIQKAHFREENPLFRAIPGLDNASQVDPLIYTQIVDEVGFIAS